MLQRGQTCPCRCHAAATWNFWTWYQNCWPTRNGLGHLVFSEVSCCGRHLVSSWPGTNPSVVSRLIGLGPGLRSKGPWAVTWRFPFLPIRLPRFFLLFEEIRFFKGMVPTKNLERLCGLFAWVAHIIPAARPWVAQLWAAVDLSKQITETGPVGEKTRHRNGLTLVKLTMPSHGFPAWSQQKGVS